jgi:hypothetical protein
MGIMGSKTLGQDILNSNGLDYGPNRSTGNDSRTLGSRFQENPAGAEMSYHLMGYGRVFQVDVTHILLGLLDTFADGLGDLMGFPQSISNVALAVTDHNDS